MKAVGPLDISEAAVDIAVTGYASPTGSEQTNATVAQQRADAVAQLLQTIGFREVSATGSPSRPARRARR
jgi:outer membrane protein OmpA-like peptidoglycan-associated protein